jgi:hypothetical protein
VYGSREAMVSGLPYRQAALHERMYDREAGCGWAVREAAPAAPPRRVILRCCTMPYLDPGHLPRGRAVKGCGRHQAGDVLRRREGQGATLEQSGLGDWRACLLSVQGS